MSSLFPMFLVLISSTLVCSLKPKDPNGSSLSISNPVWDCAPRWHEWGADQPWSCLRWTAQHLPADERSGRGRCCGGRLREITSGVFVGFYKIRIFQSAEDCHTYSFNEVFIILVIYSIYL